MVVELAGERWFFIEHREDLGGDLELVPFRVRQAVGTLLFGQRCRLIRCLRPQGRGRQVRDRLKDRSRQQVVSLEVHVNVFEEELFPRNLGGAVLAKGLLSIRQPDPVCLSSRRYVPNRVVDGRVGAEP